MRRRLWLRPSSKVSYLVSLLAPPRPLQKLTAGAVSFLSTRTRRPYPSVPLFKSRFQPTRYLRHWGVYLKLGVPKPGSGLPLLVYVGSATGVMGFCGRFMSHLSGMIRGK